VLIVAVAVITDQADTLTSSGIVLDPRFAALVATEASDTSSAVAVAFFRPGSVGGARPISGSPSGFLPAGTAINRTPEYAVP
jgi:hypothetical protein